MSSIDAYGWLGWEMEIDSHIKTRLIFAIVGQDPKRLAWYMFSEDIREAWQLAFVSVATGDRKLDRNEVFGNAISYPTLNAYNGPDITELAPAIGPRAGRAASLELTDDSKNRTTSCAIRGLSDPGNHLVDIDFDLESAGKRREMNMKRTGHVFLIGAGRFSAAALKHGLRGRSGLTNGVDPYGPTW
jgi:hypothetical protein